jgi:nudix-type nucleoside diphosphatase (YffH/AdpP family)
MARIVGRKELYKGWSTLSQVRIEDPAGKIVVREIEEHGSAACVLPVNRERRTAVLVRQIRAPLLAAAGLTEHLEAIAGLIEDEPPATTATREAREEAGLSLTNLRELYTAWTMPGLSTERMVFFLADYDRFSPEHVDNDGDEETVPVEMALMVLDPMVARGELNDLKTLLLLRELQRREPALFV